MSSLALPLNPADRSCSGSPRPTEAYPKSLPTLQARPQCVPYYWLWCLKVYMQANNVAEHKELLGGEGCLIHYLPQEELEDDAEGGALKQSMFCLQSWSVRYVALQILTRDGLCWPEDWRLISQSSPLCSQQDPCTLSKWRYHTKVSRMILAYLWV